MNDLFDTPWTFSGEDSNVWSFPDSNGISQLKYDMFQRVKENLLEVKNPDNITNFKSPKDFYSPSRTTCATAVSKPDFQVS